MTACNYGDACISSSRSRVNDLTDILFDALPPDVWGRVWRLLPRYQKARFLKAVRAGNSVAEKNVFSPTNRDILESRLEKHLRDRPKPHAVYNSRMTLRHPLQQQPPRLNVRLPFCRIMERETSSHEQHGHRHGYIHSVAGDHATTITTIPSLSTEDGNYDYDDIKTDTDTICVFAWDKSHKRFASFIVNIPDTPRIAHSKALSLATCRNVLDANNAPMRWWMGKL